MVTGALSWAELGTCIPDSGAEYPYLLAAFPEAVAYLFSWVCVFLTRPASVSIITLTSAQYILTPMFEDGCGTPPDTLCKALAVVIICESVHA